MPPKNKRGNNRRTLKFLLDTNDVLISYRQSFYQVLRFLGKGGNAQTYLVLCTKGENRGVLFAAKVFYRITKPERRAEFLAETKLLEQISHPCIMKIFDYGQKEDAFPFMIVQHLDRTLDHQLPSFKNDVLTKLTYCVQLCAALNFLASQQIVHRDVKPANIFLQGSSCVLGDFGLAKALVSPEADRMTPLKNSVGPGMPLAYRTPDLVAYANGSRPLGVESDVFQAGLVLTKLFTRKNPQRSVGRTEILTPVELDPIPHVQERLGPAITNLLHSMLNLDPSQRPSADDLLSSWEGLLIDEARFCDRQRVGDRYK